MVFNSRYASVILRITLCFIILSTTILAEENEVVNKSTIVQERELEEKEEASEKDEADKEGNDKEEENDKKNKDSEESESPTEKALAEGSSKGVTIRSTITLDNTWNCFGGIKTTPYYGAFEGTFEVGVTIKSEPVFHYEGGVIFIDFQSHHGRQPSKEFVGSFVRVVRLESPDFDQLYALWYKQNFGKRFWFLVGKSDANDNFECVEHAFLFENSGYLGIPTIPFFPYVS